MFAVYNNPLQGMVLSSFYGRGANSVGRGRPCEIGLFHSDSHEMGCPQTLHRCGEENAHTRTPVPMLHAVDVLFGPCCQSCVERSLLRACQHHHLLFSCFNSDRTVHSSFHLIDGRNQGLCSGPRLLAGYTSGALCPFPPPFSRSQGIRRDREL